MHRLQQKPPTLILSLRFQMSLWISMAVSLCICTNIWAADRIVAGTTVDFTKQSSQQLQPASSAEKQLNNANSQVSCGGDSIITMGYKYGEGSNPFALVGKCIKLKNVTPIQYLSAQKALVEWRHRGEKGTVLVEDRSKTQLSINNTKSLTGRSIGTYEYGTVLGSKAIIPHLIIE